MVSITTMLKSTLMNDCVTKKIIKKTEAFALGRHFIDNGQIFDFQSAKIIASENSFYKRTVLILLY